MAPTGSVVSEVFEGDGSCWASLLAGRWLGRGPLSPHSWQRWPVWTGESLGGPEGRHRPWGRIGTSGEMGIWDGGRGDLTNTPFPDISHTTQQPIHRDGDTQNTDQPLHSQGDIFL